MIRNRDREELRVYNKLIMKTIQSITKRGRKCSAVVDGEKIKVSLEAASKFRLKEGTLDDEAYANFAKLNDFCLCKKYLFDMVARRSWTVAAARQYLTDKGYDPENIEKVLAIAEEEHCLSDAEYAENYIRDRSGRTGEYRLRKELKQRGVADAVISEALEKQYSAADDYENALALARKRMEGRERSIATPKARERVLRYLIWRGYDYETARKVVNKIAAEK